MNGSGTYDLENRPESPPESRLTAGKIFTALANDIARDTLDGRRNHRGDGADIGGGLRCLKVRRRVRIEAPSLAFRFRGKLNGKISAHSFTERSATRRSNQRTANKTQRPASEPSSEPASARHH